MAEKKQKRPIGRTTSTNLLNPDNVLCVVSKTEVPAVNKKHHAQRSVQSKTEPQKYGYRFQHSLRTEFGSRVNTEAPMRPRTRTSAQTGKKRSKRSIRVSKIDSSGKKAGADTLVKCATKQKNPKQPKQKQIKKQIDKTSSSTKTKLCFDKALVPIGAKTTRQKPAPSIRVKEVPVEMLLVLAKSKDVKLARKTSPTKTKDGHVEKKVPAKNTLQVQKFPAPTKQSLQRKPSPAKLSIGNRSSPTSLLQRKLSPILNRGVRFTTKPTQVKPKETQRTASPTKRKIPKKAKPQSKDKYSIDRPSTSKLMIENFQSKQPHWASDDHGASNVALAIFERPDSKEQTIQFESPVRHKTKSTTKQGKKTSPVMKTIDGKGTEPKSKRVLLPLNRDSHTPYNVVSPTQNTSQQFPKIKATRSPMDLEFRSDHSVGRRTTVNAVSDTSFQTDYSYLPTKKVSKSYLSKFSSETLAAKNSKRPIVMKKITSPRRQDSATGKPPPKPKVTSEPSRITTVLQKIGFKANDAVQNISSALDFEMYKNSTGGILENKKDVVSLSSTSLFLGLGGSSPNFGKRQGLKLKTSGTPCLGLLPETQDTPSTNSQSTIMNSSLSDDTGETVIARKPSSRHIQPEGGEPYSKALAIRDSSTILRHNRVTIAKKMEMTKRKADAWTEAIRRMKKSPLTSGSTVVHSHVKHRVATGTRRAARREIATPSSGPRQAKKNKAKKKIHNLDGRLPITITSITPVPGPEPSVADPILIGHTKFQLRSILKRGPPPTTFKIALADSLDWKTARAKRSVHWSPSTELLELENEANRIGRLRRVPSGPLMYLI